MELQNCLKLVAELFKQHLPNTEWKFKFDSAQERFGLCSYRRKTISLSYKMVLLNDESDVRDTILHEIAHALVGSGEGHNWYWQQKALEIGCNGKRCYNSKTIAQPKPNYIGKCPNCGRTEKRYKLKKSTTRLACSYCCKHWNKGKWDLRFIFVWKKVK